MLKSEIYAWCLALSVGGLVLAFVGWLATLAFVIGMVLGDYNVAWVDDIFRNKKGDGVKPSPEGSPRRVNFGEKVA